MVKHTCFCRPRTLPPPCGGSSTATDYSLEGMLRAARKRQAADKRMCARIEHEVVYSMGGPGIPEATLKLMQEINEGLEARDKQRREREPEPDDSDASEECWPPFCKRR